MESESKFQEWYAENADTLNRRRRRRYKKDSDYRKAVLVANRAYREKQRAVSRTEQKKRLRAVRIMSTESSWKTVEIEVNGVKTPMYTIGALARAARRGISTVRVWEREGVLPPTPYRSAKGDRLYSVGAVEEILKVLKQDGRLKETAKLNAKKPAEVVPRAVRFSDGVVRRVPLYRVGTLAKVMGRTVVAIGQMEKAGRLPITPLRASSLEYRLYTMKMIEAVKEHFDRNGGRMRGKEWVDFFDAVEAEWQSQKVIGAKVVED
jgi:hypothetical protein